MRVAAVQWDTRDAGPVWRAVAESAADLVVLPELCFSPWLPDRRSPDAAAWTAAITEHETAIARVGELGARVVVGSRPVLDRGRRFNESFVWMDGHLVGPAHRKAYLPDEPGYWEASWYDRGAPSFEAIDTPVGRVGVMLCTELWFLEHARALGQAGVDLLIVPRATPRSSLAKWTAGGVAAAVVSGAFCISANQAGRYEQADMGGGSWIIEPEEGAILGRTDGAAPVLVLDIDAAVARRAKTTYPRYVRDHSRPVHAQPGRQ